MAYNILLREVKNGIEMTYNIFQRIYIPVVVPDLSAVAVVPDSITGLEVVVLDLAVVVQTCS